jgi:hypothetical protein
MDLYKLDEIIDFGMIEYGSNFCGHLVPMIVSHVSHNYPYGMVFVNILPKKLGWGYFSKWKLHMGWCVDFAGYNKAARWC